MRPFEIAFSADQVELRGAISSFLAASGIDVKFSDPADPAASARTWQRLSRELELTGLGAPEPLGGSGSWLEVCIALEEMGYASYPGPYFASIGLAQSLLLALPPNEVRDALIGTIASGRTVASVVLSECYGDGTGELEATRSADGWVLAGHTAAVLNGTQASVVLAPVRIDSGVGVFAFETGGPGVRARAENPLDVMRDVATMSLEAAPATLVAERVAAAPLALAQARSQAALACESAGGMQACLEATVDYITQRHQFGRAIGSFQSLKHMAADMLVMAESARALAYEAAETVCGPADAVDWLVVSAAKAFSSDSYLELAGNAIQLHGAIGFTWEQGVHRFYRRAVSTRALLGNPDHHRRLIAERLSSPEPTLVD